MKIPVLGIAFDALTLPQAVQRAQKLLASGDGGMIATVNSEILLQCRQNAPLATFVSRADLLLADGIGVVIASRILGTPLPERVTGADLTERLLENAAQRGGSVFLFGACPGVAARAAANLRRRFPGLVISGTQDGYTLPWEDVRILAEKSGTELLLVGLGAPLQESFMVESREGFHAVMIGVGGLLDVLAGDLPRAPESWQRLGAEWLFRLLHEPRRFRRIVRLPMILILALKERWKNGTQKGPVG